MGGGGVKSEYEQRGGGLCGVCVCVHLSVSQYVCVSTSGCLHTTRECLCVMCFFLFEVCPPKREMRGSDLLFFWWARCEEALLHNY